MRFNKIILLSGAISSGKSTLAKGLAKNYRSRVFKTSEYLKQVASKDMIVDRKALQDAGDELDRETRGKWVLDELIRHLPKEEEAQGIIVDSIRIWDQVKFISDFFWPRVIHIHLTAPPEDLKERFKSRQKRGLDKETDYAKIKQNQTESQIEELAFYANLVIDTKRSTDEDVLTRAISYIDTQSGSGQGFVDVIIGGQYGSEGKGQIVSYIGNEYDIHIRVGGPNAGHSVFEGTSKRVYHQIPSGTKLNKRSILVIGPGAVIDSNKLLDEIKACNIEDNRLFIDYNAMIINEEDKKREVALVKRIGSTGQGVGSATARRIMRGEDVKLARDVPELSKYVTSTTNILDRAYAENKKILLEGTQGAGLSLYHGPYPYVTSRDTFASGCLSEAGISPKRVRRIIMVCRTYPIRVEDPRNETSGPLNEITWDEVANRSGYNVDVLKSAERTSTTNRQRRIGEFEWENIRKAAVLNGATDIALTFTDYIDKKNANARRYEQLTEPTLRFIEEVERVTQTSVSLIATGFNDHSIIDRRHW